MTQEQILGIIRHVLTTVGGIVVAKGTIDESTMVTVVGALTSLLGVAWSIWAKRKA